MKKYVGIDTDEMNYFASRQLNSQWCWAACIKMILKYYGVNITQKQIVYRTYGIDELGKLHNKPASNKTIHKNLNNWSIDNNGEKYIVQAKIGLGKIPANVLLNELTDKRPIIVAYKTGINTAHAVVITGASYVMKNGNRMITSVIVRDPWPNKENKENWGRIEYVGKDLADLMNAFWLVRVKLG